VRIINAIGENCFSSTLKKGTSIVDISNLTSGYYFIQAGTQTKKLIIQ
jgi:hypothetical protein